MLDSDAVYVLSKVKFPGTPGRGVAPTCKEDATATGNTDDAIILSPLR
jgi:hypothetical protein